MVIRINCTNILEGVFQYFTKFSTPLDIGYFMMCVYTVKVATNVQMYINLGHICPDTVLVTKGLLSLNGQLD